MIQAMAATIPAESREDAELAEAALQRSDEFGLLYERYLPRVYRYLLSRCGSRDEAADLTQIAFTRAYVNLARYQPGRAPFAAWLFRIARNAAADAYRKRRATVSWDGLPEALTAANGTQPDAIAEKHERLARLRVLLERIEPAKRELLVLRFASDLSSREIAVVVGKSEAAVKKRLTRTIAQLKEYYPDEL